MKVPFDYCAGFGSVDCSDCHLVDDSRSFGYCADYAGFAEVIVLKNVKKNIIFTSPWFDFSSFSVGDVAGWAGDCEGGKEP